MSDRLWPHLSTTHLWLLPSLTCFIAKGLRCAVLQFLVLFFQMFNREKTLCFIKVKSNLKWHFVILVLHEFKTLHQNRFAWCQPAYLTCICSISIMIRLKLKCLRVLFPGALVSTKNFIDFAFTLEKKYTRPHTHRGILMSAFMSWASLCSAALTLFLLTLCLQFPILLEQTSPFPLYHTISSFVTLSLFVRLPHYCVCHPIRLSQDSIDLPQWLYYVIKTALDWLSHQKVCS